MAHLDEVSQEGAVGKAKLEGRKGVLIVDIRQVALACRGVVNGIGIAGISKFVAYDTNVGFHLLEKSRVVGKESSGWKVPG